MNLIFHLSRDYLTQQTVEQYIELADAYSVANLAIVTNVPEVRLVAATIRNIRNKIGFKICEDLDSALLSCGGFPILLSPRADLEIESYHWPKNSTIVVGDDRGDMPEPVLPAVQIKTPGRGLLWSQQAAAIGLYCATRPVACS